MTSIMDRCDCVMQLGPISHLILRRRLSRPAAFYLNIAIVVLLVLIVGNLNHINHFHKTIESSVNIDLLVVILSCVALLTAVADCTTSHVSILFGLCVASIFLLVCSFLVFAQTIVASIHFIIADPKENAQLVCTVIFAFLTFITSMLTVTLLDHTRLVAEHKRRRVRHSHAHV